MTWEKHELTTLYFDGTSQPFGVKVTIRGTCSSRLQDKAATLSKAPTSKAASDVDGVHDVDGCPDEQTADTAD